MTPANTILWWGFRSTNDYVILVIVEILCRICCYCWCCTLAASQRPLNSPFIKRLPIISKSALCNGFLNFFLRTCGDYGRLGCYFWLLLSRLFMYLRLHNSRNSLFYFKPEKKLRETWLLFLPPGQWHSSTTEMCQGPDYIQCNLVALMKMLASKNTWLSN